MKVQELIDYLKKCHPDYDVTIEECTIHGIVEHTDVITPEASYVNLWS